MKNLKNEERVVDFFRYIGRIDLWESSTEDDYLETEAGISYFDPQNETGATAYDSSTPGGFKIIVDGEWD
jgi:hypothetical protein